MIGIAGIVGCLVVRQTVVIKTRPRKPREAWDKPGHAGERGVIHARKGCPTLMHRTLVDNHSLIGFGGAIFDQDGQLILRNSIVWGNFTTRGLGYSDQIHSGFNGTTLATYSNVQGGWVDTNNINADPLFTNPGARDYTLQGTSPCKNAGENGALPADVGNLDWDSHTSDETIPKDLGLLARVRYQLVDIGAFECPFAEE